MKRCINRTVPGSLGAQPEGNRLIVKSFVANVQDPCTNSLQPTNLWINERILCLPLKNAQPAEHK